MKSNHSANKRGLLTISLSALLLILGLATTSSAGQSGEFNGSWVANGVRESFPFSADRSIALFKISGHVHLQTNLGKKSDYWSECVGLSDSATGVAARCVWKALDGPEIYITLQSDQMQPGTLVSGTIVGGSEHFEGITGSLTFLWSTVYVQDEGGKTTVTGQTLDLKGLYQIP